MTVTRRFFSAPSLTQALLAAARHHKVDPDDVAYEVIDKKHGFLKTPRGVVIEVDPEAPTRPRTEEPKTEARPPVAPETPEVAAAEVAAATPVPGTEDHPGLLPVSVETPKQEIELTAVEPAVSPEPEEHPALTSVPPRFGAEAAGGPDLPDIDQAGGGGPDLDPPVEPLPLGAEPFVVQPDEETAAQPAIPEPRVEPPVEPPVERAADEAVDETVTLDDELREAVAEAVDELAYLAGLRVQVATVENSGDGLAVDLEGPDGDRVVARGGRALLAMQHLLPRLLFRALGKALHCRLDCEGFHAARTARLEALARRAAERVRSGGRSWLLEPMPPDERRLVHMALADEPDIETQSVGEGFLKRVRVAQT
jgi:spoIIIJ-associated protein